eukprot:538628_1
MASLNKAQLTVSYDSIRTSNEEDTQQFSYRSTTIHSIDELRNEMQKIGTNISTVKTNWQTRVQSIQHIGNMIAGGILTKYPQDFIDLLFTFRDGICVQITELRSGVTKEIYRVLSYLAISIDDCKSNHVYLKQQIQPFIDYIIPYILKQTKQTILIISHGSNLTVRTIIKRIPIGKSIHHMITNTNVNHQKSTCLRVRCIEYIQIIIETQIYHNHYCDDAVMHKITDAIVDCISDPHPSVRYVARQCVWSLNHIYPNHEYSSYILKKISSTNSKYVLSEKMHYKHLPPPIGKGHKVELGTANKGLNIPQHKQKVIKANPNSRSARPKSALPSRTHRLELLKKKKREMAHKLRQKQNDRSNDADIIVFAKRPQTAHVTSSNINGQALRISNANDDDDGDISMKDEHVDEAINTRKMRRKISIMGNATRYSMNRVSNIQPNNTSKPMRIETETQMASRSMNEDVLDPILTRIHEAQVDGVRELTKWCASHQSIANKNDISDILLALSGFIDSMTMNKQSNANHLLRIEALVSCIAVFIPSVCMRELLRLLSKLLRVLCSESSCVEYKKRYNEYTRYFDMIAQAFVNAAASRDEYSFKSLLYHLSQTIMKPIKQKIVWLHFASVFCKQITQNRSADKCKKALGYLFGLLAECVTNPQLIEYHSLFRCTECLIMDDVMTYILKHPKAQYDEILNAQFNDVMMEILLGTIKNEAIIHVLHQYYASNTQPQSVANDRFMTPSHQNKRYQTIQKAQIESMATPPLNMYMSTPAPYNHHQKENEVSNSLNELSDADLVTVLLSKDATYIKCVFDEKNALKYLSHRINGNKAVFGEKCSDMLLYVVAIMNGDQFVLHRNALRILQAICWFYPKCVNRNIDKTLNGIIDLFRSTAPQESGELALDVITQFCKIVDYKLCAQYLLPIIEHEIERSQGRKVFAALSIFDRIIVLAPRQWLALNINEFTKVLIEAYKYHREPMRSLIYLSILLDGNTAFLNHHVKEQKIVKMMSKETDFTEWVRSHRIQLHKQ